MAESKPNKPLYDGPLGTPVQMEVPAVAQILGLDHPDVKEALHKEIERATYEILDKLPMLLDHYSIPRESKDRWLQLSYRLARVHVPGMQTTQRKRAGAPKDWGPVELAALNVEVNLLVKQGVTAMDACRALLQLPDGSWRFPRARDAKTLYRRYQDSKRIPLVVAMRKIEDPAIRRIIEESIAETAAEGRSESVADT